MQIDLDATERDTLRATLLVHLEDLRREWARTDDHAYRHDLLQSIECLERIVVRLQPPHDPARAPA